MDFDIGFLARRIVVPLLATLTFATTASTARGDTPTPTQDLRMIAAAAETAVRSLGPGVRATVGRLDDRLRLDVCDEPLETTLPMTPQGPRLSVRVACTGTKRWSVLVPVQVETGGQVVIARRALLPGTVISEADLATAERSVPGLAGCCATEPSALLGQRVRRPIAQDAVLTLDSLEAAPLIRRGEMVTIIAGAPGFEVRSLGIAMADARLGDAVRIRHSSSQRIIQARADSRGVARADR